MISKNMFYNDESFNRFVMMLDEEEKQNLFSSRIIIFGVGGVGGSVAHMLARSGIQHIALVDFDTIDKTNINRQIISNSSNIGKVKVEECKRQLLEINPNIDIEIYNFKLDDSTINSIDFSKYDYIVDCIDDIKAKKLLISHACVNGKNILCAMGAGNRYKDIPNFEIADISKTSYDPIAKILRKYCQTERIKKLNVCYTKQKATKFDCKTIGSVVYYTMNMATVMCAKIINDILGE